MVPRCLTVAGSDSGGGAGIQADLKTFARLGCHGMSAIVALTAQNTHEVRSIYEVPPSFVREQLESVLDDIGVDAVKTGMLFSAAAVEVVIEVFEARPAPLVVDPVMIASSGARLLREDAVSVLTHRLFPLATVVTPNLHEACALAGVPYSPDADRRFLAEAICALGARAVVVTGGHGIPPVDWLFTGREHVPIPVARFETGTSHGAGCTHSAALTALLARGESLRGAAVGAAEVASGAVRDGLHDLGAGEGPVDVFGLSRRDP